MCYKIILDILTAIGTVGAVAIGMAAIYHSNKNSKREIKTHKLEEIFQLIQSLSRYYGKFNELYFCIEDLRNKEKKEIQTLSDYYKIRDERLPRADRQKIIADLSRLEVLSKCYTEAPLFNELLKYEDLMFSFSDFVFNGGSLHQELKWKNGFPNYEEYFALIEGLKTQIIDQIKKR
jgi:hypothetical protein